VSSAGARSGCRLLICESHFFFSNYWVPVQLCEKSPAECGESQPHANSGERKRPSVLRDISEAFKRMNHRDSPTRGGASWTSSSPALISCAGMEAKIYPVGRGSRRRGNNSRLQPSGCGGIRKPAQRRKLRSRGETIAGINKDSTQNRHNRKTRLVASEPQLKPLTIASFDYYKAGDRHS
jgi:hypothetical protein